MKKNVVHSSFYSSLHSFFSSIISISVMLVVTIGISRLLGPADKGKYELILNTINLLSGLLGFSFQSGITYVLAAYKTGVLKVTVAIFIFTFIQGVIAFTGLKILNNTDLYSSFLPEVIIDNNLYCVMAVLTFLTLLNSYLRSILVAYLRIVEANKYDLLSRLAFVLVLVLIILHPFEGKSSYTIYIWLNCLTMLIGSMLFTCALPTYWKNTIDSPSNIKKIISFSIPSYLGNTVQLLNYRLDIFFVAYFTKDISQVGFYTLAVSIAQLIWLVPRSISSIILPKIASKNTEQANLILLTTYIAKIVLIISLLIAVVMALSIPTLLPIAYGQAFAKSTSALLLLLPGIAFFSFTNVMSAYIAGIGKPLINFYVAVLGLVVTTVFDFLLIPHYHIEGAALASTLSYMVSTFAVMYWTSTQSNLKFSQILIPSYPEIQLVVDKVRNRSPHNY